MLEYLPYIRGLISILGGTYIFLKVFQIPWPVRLGTKEKAQRWPNKYDTFLKITSIVLIANGLYDLIVNDVDRYRIGEITITEWSSSDMQVLINTCMREAKDMATDYPDITADYCKCSTNKVIEHLSYDAYAESLKKPTSEQLQLLMPIIKDCYDKFENEIFEEMMDDGSYISQDALDSGN